MVMVVPVPDGCFIVGDKLAQLARSCQLGYLPSSGWPGANFAAPPGRDSHRPQGRLSQTDALKSVI